jgi:FAD/FMN-containing dehydrogenase
VRSNLFQPKDNVIAAVSDLRTVMQGAVHMHGDERYNTARKISNFAVDHRPVLIALCETAADVQAVVRIAREHNIPLSVRGGGNDWVGRALRHDGLVIDLTRMRNVEIDATARIATLQGGATAGDLIGAASADDLVAVTGMVNTVGMAGLTLGGGYGPLTPRYGLALDNLLSAEVILFDGTCVRADASENADLFWALRGGGGNFGVVTSMQVRLYSIDSPLHGPVVFPWSQAESVLHRYVEFMASAPDELAVTAGVSFAPPDGDPVIFISPTWSGEPRRGEQIITQLQGFGTPIVSKVAQMPYSEVLRKGDEIFANVNRFAVETRWQAAITSYAISEIIAAGNHSPSPRSMITLQSFHGSPTRIPLESTAFGLRQRHFLVLIIAAWDENAEDTGRRPREWAQGLSQAIAPESLPGGYANLLAPDAYDQISCAYGSNSTRLKEIKKQFDPEGMFLSAIPLPD